MEIDDFNKLIKYYGFDFSGVYRDLSEFGLLLYLDKDKQFSLSIEAHVSSDFAVIIFNGKVNEHYVRYSEPLLNIDRSALQNVVNRIKNGQYTLNRVNGNKLKLSVLGDSEEEIFNAVLV